MDHPPADPAAILRRSLARAAAIGLILMGLVLVARLVAGQLSAAAPGAIIGAALAAIALVRLADLARAADSWLAPLSARVGLSLATAALALAPGTGRPGDWAARAILVAAAVATIPLKTLRAARGAGHARPAARPLSSSGSRAPVNPRRGLRQRLERYQRPDGTDTVRGTLVVSVARGSRAGQGHVGFCPSFAALPMVSVSTRYDGPDALVTAAEVLPWGMRIECRLADAAEEPLEIPVRIVARLAPPPSHAVTEHPAARGGARRP